MASVASERKCLHRDLFERGGASVTCDDDDAFSCRTDLTTVKASNEWRVTVRSAKCEELGFCFLGARRRKKQTISFCLLCPSCCCFCLKANLLIRSSRSHSLSLSFSQLSPSMAQNPYVASEGKSPGRAAATIQLRGDIGIFSCSS
jgi:hypothetical protein